MNKDIRNVMLVSPDKVKTDTFVNYNLSDSIVGEAIRIAQNTYLREIIGDGLLYHLKELVYNAIKGLEDNIDDPGNAIYADLLDNYIEPYLQKRSQVEVLRPVSFDTRNIGVSAKYDTNIAQATMQNVEKMEDYYKTLSVDAENRLKGYLKANRESFPEIVAGCSCGANTPDMRLSINTGLWLG